ncbi:MAG: hypothetical protein ACHREM_22770 [Polyangiales bacterium]
MNAHDRPLRLRVAAIRRPSRPTLGVWIALAALASLLLFVAVELREPHVAGLIAAFVGFFAYVSGALRDANYKAWRSKGELVEVDSSGLRVGEARVAQLDQVVFAHVVPNVATDVSTVRIVLAHAGDRILEIDVRTRAEARAIVDRLRCGPGQTRLSLRLPSRLAMHPWIALAVAFAPIALTAAMSMLSTRPGHEGREAIVFVLTALSTIAAAVLLGTRTLVEIGADRLRARWLTRDDTALLADVASAERVGLRVAIRVKDGRAIDLPAVALASATVDPQAFAIVERLDHARAGSARVHVAALASAPHDPGRAIATVREWVVSGGGFRDEVASVDDLLAALESPTQPQRVRVLAAVALDERLRDQPSREASEEVTRAARAMLESAFATLLDRVGAGDRGAFDALAEEMLEVDELASLADQATAEATSADPARASR